MKCSSAELMINTFTEANSVQHTLVQTIFENIVAVQIVVIHDKILFVLHGPDAEQ